MGPYNEKPSVEYDYEAGPVGGPSDAGGLPVSIPSQQSGIMPQVSLPGEEEEYELDEGQEAATAEEQALLDSIMTSVEGIAQGQLRDKINSTIDASPELWQNIPLLGNAIIQRISHKLDEQGIEDDGAVFFGENGAIQQTVEMLWDMAHQQGHPAAEDDEQFVAAYFHTLKLVGESLEEDEDSAREAQDYLLELEAGTDVVGEAAQQLEEQTLGVTSEVSVEEALGPAGPAQGFPGL